MIERIAGSARRSDWYERIHVRVQEEKSAFAFNSGLRGDSTLIRREGLIIDVHLHGACLLAEGIGSLESSRLV